MIRVREVKVPVFDNDILKYLKKKLKTNINSYEIYKKSLDARDKNNIYYVYEVNVSIDNERDYLKKNKNKDIFKSIDLEFTYPKIGEEKLKNRPVVVGMGPAGLFAALLLADLNYRPIIIERGKCVEERLKDIDEFLTTGKLETNSNIQFGEGGAGTFSDGKLNTLIKDKDNIMRYVFERFVEFGAPKEIMYDYKPHIGTDILSKIVKNMREYLISKGASIYFNTTLTDFIIKNNKLVGIEVNHKDIINTNVLILATGHSARDTIRNVYTKYLNMESKAFAVGVRIIHTQEFIDNARLGNYKELLSPATYKLTYTTKNKKGVYTFCMCPGGYVVNASSEENKLVINGMSNSKRDSGYANSALVVTVNKSDYGSNLLDGLIFQEKLETLAYKIGNGLIPVQNYLDFKNNRVSDNILYSDAFKGRIVSKNLNEILPAFIKESLIEFTEYYKDKITNFDTKMLMAGIETRTSCPIRIKRNEEFVSNIEGIYPCGEGAGFAGGITSSAIDGIKVSSCIIKKYSNLY